MDIQRALQVQTAKELLRRLSSWFSSEVMAKGYQAYRDSWATVLAKKCLAWGKLATGSIFHCFLLWREDSAEKRDTPRCGQLLHPAYVKIKTVKFLLKRIRYFREILHQQIFPLYGICCSPMSNPWPAFKWFNHIINQSACLKTGQGYAKSESGSTSQHAQLEIRPACALTV